MKRYITLLLLFVFLAGCTSNSDIRSGLTLRQKILSSKGCCFETGITADYGDKLYSFRLKCTADQDGNMVFEVLAPEAISGIRGTITDVGGHLTFDGNALAFESIADGQITPVTAPWLFLRTLRKGYISASAEEKEGTYLQIDDSYKEESLHLDVWLTTDGAPKRAEILWQGRRIVSLIIENFTIL